MSDTSEVIFEDSDASEKSTEENVTIEESSDGSIDEDIIRHSTKKVQRKNVIIDSDSDNELEFERQVLSPRTRMSITGIRPTDLSESSSEIEYSDEASKDSEDHEEASKDSEDHEEASKDSEDHEEASKDSEDHEEANVSEKANLLAVSPNVTSRYSQCFESAIQNKLSSTMYQHRQNQLSNIESDNSDDIIISEVNETIEILSSDEHESYDQGEDKAKSSSPRRETKQILVQPKISAVLSQTPRAPIKPLDNNNVKYVSKEFFDKEVNKLSELKLELSNSQKLLEKISRSLPDGGRQLKLRIERLQNDEQIKSNYVASLKIEENIYPSQMNQRKHGLVMEIPDWNQLSSAVNEIKPVFTGRQGLETFNNQKALTVDRLKDLHGSLENCPAENVLADDPPGLHVSLMRHQKHALAWMAWREKQKPHGGILADDMGLGKTLTMISLVLNTKDRKEDEEDDDNDSDSDDEDKSKNSVWKTKGRRDKYRGNTLVVCPASLIRQWESEVESKVRRQILTVCVHHGNNRDTRPKNLRNYNIVVTTYNIVSREHKASGALFGIKWNRIILDEAHVIRNHKSQSSVAACKLRGKYRWALTGTPIQNKEMDVYALLKFLRCSPFDELSHWKKWIDNKSAGGQQRLNMLMKSLMLRRTKIQLRDMGELQCLPEKRTELIEVHLNKNEMNVYQKVMIYSRSLFSQFLMQRAERNTDLMYKEQGNRPTFMQSRDPNGAYYKVHQKFTKLYQGTKQIKSHDILVLLLRLRQICCHPGLIDAMLEDDDISNLGSDNDTSQPEIDLLEQLNKLAIKDSSLNDHSKGSNTSNDENIRPEDQEAVRASARVLHRSNPIFDLHRPSSKMLAVINMVKQLILTTNDKAIIVSQWTSVLLLIDDHLKKEGIMTLSLTGKVAIKNRQDIVNEFNNPESKKKNLTSIFDRWRSRFEFNWWQSFIINRFALESTT